SYQMTSDRPETRGVRSIGLQEPGVLQRRDLRFEAFELGVLAGGISPQVVGAEIVGEAAGRGQLVVGAGRAPRQALVVVHRGVAVPRCAGIDLLDNALVDAGE